MLALAAAGVAQMQALAAAPGPVASLGFGVLVDMGFPPYDECGVPARHTPAAVTLDGAISPLPRAHLGFPRTVAHPDWWTERHGDVTKIWRLRRDGSHRFWWRLANTAAPERWSPTGQRAFVAVNRPVPHGSGWVVADVRHRTVRDLPLPATWNVMGVAWLDARRLAVAYYRPWRDAPTYPFVRFGLALVHADAPRASVTLPSGWLTPGRARDNTGDARLAWSPAAHRLAIQIGSQGWVADLGHRRSTPIPGKLYPFAAPSWSPDGRRLLLWRPNGPNSSRGWMADVPSLRQQRMPALGQVNFVWIPGGHELVTETGDPPTGRNHRLAVIGGDGRVERIVPVRWPAGLAGFSLISADGVDRDQGILARAADDPCY